MILYPGSTTFVERAFPETETNITVVAKDFNGLTIPSSPAIFIDGKWRTQLSIPDVAPVCTIDTGNYKLIWTKTDGTSTVEQEFQVVAYEEGMQRPIPAAFGVAGISLIDELYLPAGSTNIEVEILNPNDGSVVIVADDGSVVSDDVSTPSVEAPGSIRAVVEFTSPSIGVGEYIAHWRYEIGNVPMHEYRQAFVISPKLTGMISSMRLFLDQSGVIKWLGHMQFSDVELIDCMYRGADRINAHPPQVTAYSPDSMPGGLVHALKVATLHEMLNRLYLAEGLSSFDFQGASIQVNVDRTPFIQTKMDEMNSWLESNLTNVKTATLSRGSIGILHVSISQGGLNNNYRSRGSIINPAQFQLSRQIGGYLFG